MELNPTTSEQELTNQVNLALLELSPSRKASNSSIANYIASMTSCEDNPGMSRCPTSKECGEIIKKLRNENWDLKCRFVTEKLSKSAPTTVGGITTLSAANIQELAREFQQLKDARETAERKARELEIQNMSLQESIATGQQREELLQQRNEELIQKLDILDHEYELAKLRSSNECLLDNSLMNLQIHDHDDSASGSCLVPEADQAYIQIVQEQRQQLTEFEKAIHVIKEKLDIATEDLTTKTQLIESLETLLKDKNQLTEKLELENSKYREKILTMTQAFKELGYQCTQEIAHHNNLKTKYKELLDEYDGVRATLEQMKQEFETLASKRDQRSDDLSPDLGIESGIEVSRMENVLKAPKDNSADEKIRSLKAINKELANRLRQTKLALDKTMERLSITTAEKEQVEKAVCRQLHRTHGILRAARKNLENPNVVTVPSNDVL